jgi:hypothetical protein
VQNAESAMLDCWLVLSWLDIFAPILTLLMPFLLFGFVLAVLGINNPLLYKM